MNSFTLENGKYTVRNDNGLITVDRYSDENWRNCTGDGFILALVHEIERLREDNENLEYEILETKLLSEGIYEKF